MAKRSVRPDHDDDLDDDLPAEPAPAPSRWFFWLVGWTCFFAALAWFAPAIIASTPLRDQILAAALGDYPGKVRVGSMTLGWLAPIELHDIVVEDPKGESLLTAARAASNQSLLSLVAERRQLGGFTIDKPHLKVTLRPDGSNLEDAVWALLAALPASESAEAIECVVTLADGTAEITDVATGQGWKLSQLAGEATVAAQPSAKLAGVIDDSQAAAPREVSATFTWGPKVVQPTEIVISDSPIETPSAPSPAGPSIGTLRIAAKSLPLALVRPLAARGFADLTLSGDATGDVTLEMDDQAGQWAYVASGAVTGDNVAIGSPSLLGAERVVLALAKLSGQLGMQGDHVAAENLFIESDVASIKIKGAAQLPKADTSTFAALMDVARREDWKLEGVLDLAKLAKLLPQTLRLRPGTQITAGQVQLVAESGQAAGQRAWRGELTTANLAAVDGDRPITWDKPLKVIFAAHDSAAGPVIDHLRADASFLELAGQGTLDKGTLTAKGNLDQLAAELGRFVDLAALGMAGKLEGRVEWERDATRQFAAAAQLAVADFQLNLPGQPAWRESQLAASIKATGSGDLSGLARLDTAEATLFSGADRLDAILTAPIADINTKTLWPVTAKLSGDLGTWQPRLALVLPLSGTVLGGQAVVDAKGAFSLERVELANASIDATQVVIRRQDLQFDEPQVKLEMVGNWDTARREFNATMVSLASTSLALRADSLRCEFPAGGAPILAGQVTYRGDLQRLQRYWQGATAPTMVWVGQLAGDAQLAHEADVTQAKWSATLAGGGVYQRVEPPRAPATIPAASDPNAGWQPVWTERQVTLAGNATYTSSTDRLKVEQVQIAADSLAFRAAGTMTGIATQPNVDLAGQVEYDLAQLAERFRGVLGPIQLAGRESRPFALKGPLTAAALPNSLATPPINPVPVGPLGATPDANAATISPELAGQLALGWQAVDLYGLKIGPGVFDCRLEQGVVQAPPLDVAIDEGRLRIAPRLLLNQSPMTLVLDKGKAVENVRISPELCRTWLKYVAPLLADTAQVEGRFSVDLAGAGVPLANPGRATAGGILQVHSAHAGPGPLAQSVIGLVRQVKAIIDKKSPLALIAPTQPVWLDLADQKVEFQVAEGRVYHRHVTMQVGDVQVRTVGSVGFDQTLDILAEIPVRDEWVAKEKALIGLKGQNLTIPIRGTFAQPKIDNKVLKDLAARLAGGLLDSFLPPRP